MHSGAAEHGIWQFGVKVGQLNYVYNAGQPAVQFATVKSHRLGLYRHYMIDFGSLQQKNLDSERIRSVRLLHTMPDVQAATSEATEANSCDNVTAATLMIEEDTMASSSHFGNDSQPDSGAHPQSTPDAKPGASEVTGANTSNIVTAATLWPSIEDGTKAEEHQTSRTNKMPRTGGQHSPPDKRFPGDDGHQ